MCRIVLDETFQMMLYVREYVSKVYMFHFDAEFSRMETFRAFCGTFLYLYKKIKDLNSAAKVDKEQKVKNKTILNKNIPFLLWPS